MNLFIVCSCFGTRSYWGRPERRIPHPRPAQAGVPAGVQCPPLPFLSRQRAHTAAFAFLLNGSFRIRRKKRRKKKINKNPTHFSDLLSRFPFTPGMMVNCASPAASPETAFQPHFLGPDAGGAHPPPLPPPPSGARSPTFAAFPYPCRPSRRSPQPPSGGGGGGGGAVRAAGAPCIDAPAAAEPIRDRSPALPPPTSSSSSSSPGWWRCFPPPCQRYPGAVLPLPGPPSIPYP